MSDIVERLRGQYDAWNNPPSPELPDGAGVALEAADEIERLRAALRYIAWEQKEGDEPHLIARAALEGK